MGKDKILIIEKSDLIKNFLVEKLTEFGFDTIYSREAFDGLIKMKNNLPDLVILDYQLTLNTKINFFNEKRNYKTISEIPVIMLATKIDKNELFNLVKNKVAKIFTKPIKIDLLLNEISAVLNKNIEIDKTPAMIDIHLNDDILFVEVSQGFNKDKIDSIKYKIKEIKDIYKLDYPKVLIIIFNVEMDEKSAQKFFMLLDNIVQYANPHLNAIKILTSTAGIKKIVLSEPKYSLLEVTDDINKAIEKLSDVKIDELIHRDKNFNEEEISWSNEEYYYENNDEDAVDIGNENFDKKYKISIVDDDELIRDLISGIFIDTGVRTFVYIDGLDFVNDLEQNIPDLIFLDLMMPNMNGFEVLDYMKRNNMNIPVIVFSALSKSETVRKVLAYGIKSYIVKPISPDIIFKKASEILKSSF
jgi:DNA-binding response OmpR family regulator